MKSSNILRGLLVTMRPKQWVKNLACLAGLIFANKLLEPDAVLRAWLSVLGFCAAASAVYLFNDSIDREKDRANPRTATRPIASGTLPVGIALAASAVLVAVSLGTAALLGSSCLVIAAGYLALNVLYGLKLKRTVIADVMCIALGFVLRVLFGVYAVQVLPSPWIVMCMFFLALFLGFGKRLGELEQLGDDSAKARDVLAKYGMLYLQVMLGITAAITILSYSLYTISPHKNPTLVITIVPVVYCVLRYLHQVMVEGRGQSPERLLFRDKMLWLGILAWLGLCVAVLYGKLNLYFEYAPH